LVARLAESKVSLTHGSGSSEAWRFIKELIVDRVPENLRRVEGGYGLEVMDDGAVLKLNDGSYLVVTTDSFTVNPLKFPGGDIGSLAVHGVINDLVVMGAKPIAFMDTLVVEEGFPESELREVVDSMINSLVSEGIALIGGDFKVMPRGSIDKLVITGVGIGVSRRPIVDVELKPGDKIIVTGYIAEHGATILAAQLGLLDKVTNLRSDTKPLTKTVFKVIETFEGRVHAARDPTRGGLAATLNEWASSTSLTIKVYRDKIPLREEVKAFLEALGVDPLSLASEGIAVLAVDPEVHEEVLKELRRVGEVNAEVVGEVITPPNKMLVGKVVGVTEVGGKVLIESKSINLPRIC